MTDKEIESKAKETSGGNFYYEQGFAYGYELGLEEGRKELEQWKQEWQDAQIKANEEGFARTIMQIKMEKLEKENEQLRTELNKYQKVTGELLSPINGILKTPHD